MTVKFPVLVVFVMVFFSHGLRAQESSATVPAADSRFTVETAVQEGLDRSPEIQRARAAQSESQWHHFEWVASVLPRISADAHHYFLKQYTVTNFTLAGSALTFPGFYPTDTVSLDVIVPIFDGLASIRNLQSASSDEDAVTAELAFAEFQLKEEIRLAFYKYLAASDLLSVAEQNVKTLEDHLKQVQAQRGGGVATGYDVLRVQVQLNEARADAIDSQDGLETSRKKLTELLGLENDPRLPAGSLPIPDASLVKTLTLNEIPKDRSDLQALEFRAQAAARSHQAASAWFIPSIYLSGDYLLYNSQSFNVTVQDTGNFLNAYSFGVFLKWNIFDGGAAIAREREASYRAIQADCVAQVAKLKIPYDFEFWKRRYLSNTDHYISKKFDITRSEESVRLAKEEERAGTRTSTETLDAELDLFRAKAGAVNALVNAAEARIRLEQALGREI